MKYITSIVLLIAGMVTWRIPSQTIIARDPLTREVVTPELLQKHLSLFYLHRDVSEALNPTLTQSLGIESLTTEHLLQIGKALITEWNDISEGEYRNEFDFIYTVKSQIF